MANFHTYFAFKKLTIMIKWPHNLKAARFEIFCAHISKLSICTSTVHPISSYIYMHSNVFILHTHTTHILAKFSISSFFSLFQFLFFTYFFFFAFWAILNHKASKKNLIANVLRTVDPQALRRPRGRDPRSSEVV